MANRKPFYESVIPLHADRGRSWDGLLAHPLEPGDRLRTMRVIFSLALPKRMLDEMKQRVARGEVAAADELANRYVVDPESADKLISWLKGEGFEIVHVTSGRTSINTRARVDQIERSLDVRMVRVTREGVTYIGASDAPSLPDDVAGAVQHIGDLQPFLFSPIVKGLTAGRTIRTSLAGGFGPATVNAPPFLVSDLCKAYGADGLSHTGKGQEIAILIDMAPKIADLIAFWNLNQVPNDLGRIVVIPVDGPALPDNEGEANLDTQWASSVAPGASIRIYACGSPLTAANLNLGLNQILEDAIARPGLRQVSISCGQKEATASLNAAQMLADSAVLGQLATAGVNVFVSSGNGGSNPDSIGQPSQNAPLDTMFFASSEDVIAVGGTSLTLGINGNVANETAWSRSGGGYSNFFSRQDWQVALTTGLRRMVPDVSLAADPDHGGVYYIHDGELVRRGGTSGGPPIWAAFCAIMNEARVASGRSALGFLNPLMYPLRGSACFRDITTGGNGAYQAEAGYDTVTGIGVPNVKALMAALV